MYTALLFAGWASVSFIAIGNSTIQLSSESSMRGRVISLWQVAFQGTTPIGGPAIGWVIALSDPRVGLAVGGVSCFVAALGGRRPGQALPPGHGPGDSRTRHPGPGRPAARRNPLRQEFTLYQFRMDKTP